MQPTETMLKALEERAQEQSKVLTLWAQQELGLGPEYAVKVKALFKQRRLPKVKVEPLTVHMVYDQDPEPKDWETVKVVIEELIENAKPWNKSRMLWNLFLVQFADLRKIGNKGYMYHASRFNVHCKNTGLPFQLVRADQPGEDTLYSFMVGRSVVPLSQS